MTYLDREKRENLHKWGKARRIIDEEKIKIQMESDERYQFRIKGETSEYIVGVDIDTGKTFCPCPFNGETCSHQIAAHLALVELGVENDRYRTSED